MSIEAMNWALGVETGSASAKSVLLILANRADNKGRCYPGIDGIAEQTELARRTVIRSIKKLEEIQFVTIVHRGGDGTGRKSNLYQLNLDRTQGAKLAPCQSGTGGLSDNDDTQGATVSKQSATLTPEPKDNPKKNPQDLSKANGSHDGIAGVIPEDFYPNQHTIDYAAIHSLPDPTDSETIEEFKLHYRAHPKLCEDWQAQYLIWLRRKRVFDGGRAGGRSKSTKFEDAIERIDGR